MAALLRATVELPEWAADLSPHGVLTTDINLTIRSWSRWLACITGRSAAEAVGRPLLEVCPELAARGLDGAYRQALAGQTVVLSQRLHRYHLAIPPADEYAALFEYMPQTVQVAPLWQDGAVAGTVAVINDVSERVAREQEHQRLLVQERAARTEAERAVGRIDRLLQVSMALAGAATPSEVAGIIVGQCLTHLGGIAGLVAQMGAEGQTLEVMYAQGYPEDLVSTWRYLPLDLPSPLTEAALTRTPVFAENQEAFAARYPLLASHVSMHGRSLAALPLVVDGRLAGAVGLSFVEQQGFGAEDRSFMAAIAHQGAQALDRAYLYEAERRARAEAEAAVRIREEFLSIAAHELRTPLTSMLGNVQLLQRRMRKDGLSGERHQRLLEITIDQGHRLSRMVATMLDVSRLETGRFSLDVQPLDLEAVICRVIEDLHAPLTIHTIRVEGLGLPLRVAGDELRLEQVFYNLIGNAIKYSPQGGEVVVRVAQPRGRVVVSVEDQGIGIPAETLPSLFQPFVRAANVAEHHIAGVGIGLYVVREIVARHGGEITVVSAEGRGSTFTVTLPSDDGATCAGEDDG